MAQSIPKHLLEKFSLLYFVKKGGSFTHKDAQTILRISKSYAGQVLPILVKSGWIISHRLGDDRRKKVYEFKNPHIIIEEIGQELNLKATFEKHNKKNFGP
ncbi:MarR family transcriptional regulator [Methanofollis tationis]|uniref:MarR family transcriptional regulator n=1 Tax=Methanofollis tationis TaxID=81417 RepID=A0A7K4HNH9_9EURY|nr:helix-turn-helix domain-containing protein [Methanofollis tationis]NVO66833.1 MarR family transcriptional regulator [Methanofollis tationis]